MFADMHMHTYFSDGSQSPEEVIGIAKEQGLSVISICDHDTIMAYERLRAACKAAEIKLIQGTELDVYWNGMRLHLLAYNFDTENKAMLELLRKSRAELDQISVEMLIDMEKDYPQVSLADFDSYESPLGRGGWKGINYLYDRGLTDSVIGGRNFHMKYNRYRPDFCTLEYACQIIRDAHGVPVLAHPGNYWMEKQDKMPDILKSLKSSGIGGIECYYPCHSKEFTKLCVDFCRANGLCITCGGDGHGIFAREIMGVIYDIGIIKVDMDMLALDGIL